MVKTGKYVISCGFDKNSKNIEISLRLIVHSLLRWLSE